MIFTKEGLKPSPDKISVVKEYGIPESKEAVRSFLGMAGYLDKSMDNNATIAAPLYHLTRREIRFKWGESEEKAFLQTQNSISDLQTMIYYHNKPITLRILKRVCLQLYSRKHARVYNQSYHDKH